MWPRSVNLYIKSILIDNCFGLTFRRVIYELSLFRNYELSSLRNIFVALKVIIISVIGLSICIHVRVIYQVPLAAFLNAPCREKQGARSAINRAHFVTQ